MWNQDPNQSGFGGGGFSTPQGDEKKRNSKRSNSIIPVTVAQMLTARHEDDAFVSGNLELSNVTLVGLIKSVNESSTRVDYQIDDMTGPPMDVRQFNETDENEEADPANSAFPVNTYVRVNGILRSFGGKRAVNCHKMTAITDMNELTCHIMEVIYAQATSSQQIAGQGGDKGGNAMDTGDSGQIPGLTPLQSQVQMIIRGHTTERGCSVDEICENLRSVAPRAIRDAIEFLSSEGHIYSTIDDEHFQATDS